MSFTLVFILTIMSMSLQWQQYISKMCWQSWVACWANALDLQPPVECTWVGIFLISINGVQLSLDSVNLSWWHVELMLQISNHLLNAHGLEAFGSPLMECSLQLDSVNLSWVACWADALDLQPSIECTWVGSFFISINRAVCCKIQCNKFCSLRCHSWLH